MRCLVIMLRRSRLDYLGCYGNDWIATPTLDRLASESVVFDQHYGMDVQGVFPVNWLQPLWEKQLLTAYVGDERCENTLASRAGWESAQVIRRARLPLLEQESLLGGMVQTAIEWLQAAGRAESWLLWLDSGALVPPWDSAERDDEAILEESETPIQLWLNPPRGKVDGEGSLTRLEHTYAGVVGGVDQWLGMLMDFLREAGLLDQLTVFLTSDVGMALGDHGYFDPDGIDLYEEHVHLPLLIRLPAGERGGRRVQQFTQPGDLAHAIRAVLHVGSKDDSRLLNLAHGRPTHSREFIAMQAGSQAHDAALRTHQWYFLLRQSTRPPLRQLFIKPEDRYEVNDVVSQHVEVADHLELALRRILAGDGMAAELRADVLNVLQS